ncbi:MAG TPA: phosphotransferase [Acidimicrobiales bacterium]|nr:phosphotransferase [Acidimicrobiales bacterium]
MLADAEIVPYLIEQGLVSARSVVAGDVVLTTVSRRNRSCKVTCAEGPSYFVKQGVDDERRATVAREAAVHRHLERDPTMAGYLPEVYLVDDDSSVFVSELCGAGEDVREGQVRSSRFSLLQPRSLGQALARLGDVRATAELRTVLGAGPAWSPWVLSLHRPRPELLRQSSAAGIDLVRMIQGFPVLTDHFDLLREEWTASSPVHGDLKAENCIPVAKPGSTRRTRLKIVDWECATMGDPAWDVGSAFADYLAFWVRSIPVAARASPGQFLDVARHPLARMQGPMGIFWSSYAATARIAPPAAEALLLRSVRHAAARLVQSAFEQLQAAPALTAHAVCMVQLALNMLERPAQAGAHLLGVPAFTHAA